MGQIQMYISVVLKYSRLFEWSCLMTTEIHFILTSSPYLVNAVKIKYSPKQAPNQMNTAKTGVFPY